MLNLPETTSLKGYRLVIPSTCVGNVSQLTCDLLIESLKMTKIADCFHESIIPLIGAPAFSHIKDSITTAAELFHDEGSKVAILQLRSPLATPLMADFFTKLAEFVKAHGIVEVHILTSSYAYEKRQVSGTNFWCKTNDVKVPDSMPQTTDLKILGGGFAIKMWQTMVEAKIPSIILYKYVSEGDNRSDSVELLQKFDEILPIFDKTQEIKVQMPVSWQHLYGNQAPKEIY